MVWGLGFRVYMVWGLGFIRVYMVWSLGFRGFWGLL